MTTNAWKEYEEILLELFTKRKLLKVAQEIQNNIEGDGSDDILLKMRNVLNSMDVKDTGIS